MQEQVTAVEPNGDKSVDFSVDEPEGSSPPSCAAAKFVYASGSQPLQGYTIKRGVGHGGFGEIYYALSDAGKEVALKLIRRNLEIELRGIRHCLNLKHPHLLALYDVREDEHGDCWVIMEYVSGGCLADVLFTAPNGMPLDEVLHWFHGLGAGVAYLHDRGIVHRDLKPGNIFCDEGVVKVGDYGLSKFVSCSRRSGQTESVGTVHYMAPEVANGRYGKEIDIYALGVVLYEMLTGRVPFEGESVGEVLMKHLTAKPDVSMLAEPYRSVIARALEKDPAKRYDSVGQMLAALPQPADAGPDADRWAAGVCPAAGRAGAASPPPFAGRSAEVVMAELADEDPILKVVRDGGRSIQKAWNDANLNTPMKVAVLFVGAFVLLLNPWLVPLTVVLCLLYGAYRVVRAMVLSQPPVRHYAHAPASPSPLRGAAPAPAGAPPAATQPSLAHTRSGWRRKRRTPEPAAAALVMKSTRDRLTELVGSLLLSALVAMATLVVVVLVNSFRSTTTLEQGAWLLLTGIAGLTILIPSKLWEGTRGEPALRRFTLMVLGLGLGAFAYAAANLLMVHLPYDYNSAGPHYNMPASFYAPDGHPLLMAHMACFGTMLLLVRWWRQADPLRATRLGLWVVLVTTVLAYIIAELWRFPAPWLVMVAATMSISIQLASPWMPPRTRHPRTSE